jgi:hypothetical protein
MSDDERKEPARRLGVVEALVAVRDQCPSAPARALAAQALDAVRAKRAGALREQAYLVFAATQGWRGERADQVRASLKEFLESPAPPAE